MMRFKDLDKYTRFSIIVILIGAIIRLWLTFVQPASGDAAWHLSVARFIGEHHKIPLYEQLGRDIFSYPFLYHAIGGLFYNIFIVFGDDIASKSIQFVVPIFSIFTLILTFMIASKMFDKRIAFYATFFSVFVPVHFYHSYISYIDIPFMFFILLGIYLALEKKWMWSAVAIGLSNNIRIYGIAMLPLLLLILYQSLFKTDGKYSIKNVKIIIKNLMNKKFVFIAIMIIIVSMVVASPPMIRNYHYLKNPVWPGLTFIFKDSVATPWKPIGGNFFDPLDIYLRFFGIPDGNIENFMNMGIPYVGVLLGIWAIGTILFIFPSVMGLFIKKKKNLVLYLWATLIIIATTAIAIQAGYVARHFLPILPVIAILWAFGVMKSHKAYFLLIIVICAGFTLTEITKAYVAKSWWDPYQPDFRWARENIPQDAVVYDKGQSISFHIHHLTPKVIDGPGYVWITSKDYTDSSFIFDDIKDMDIELMYKNDESGIEIYRVIG